MPEIISNLETYERYIRDAIPLSEAMDFKILELSDRHIQVRAPLEANINVHGTGFAGSIYAAGALSAWALAYYILQKAELDAKLVLSKANIRYRRPVTKDIECRARITDEQAEGFLSRLREENTSHLHVDIDVGDEPAAIIEALMHASLPVAEES